MSEVAGYDGASRNGAPAAAAPSADQSSMAVHAIYEVGEVWFDLPTTATLAQLIEKLAIVGNGHGSPISIEVMLATANMPS